jgi:RNA polymerase sigma-70 factor, ECF subfamily
VDAEETVETLRPLMFSIAYRMVGSVSDAEDVVQEAFLRHQRALRDGAEVRSPKAYLSAVVTRLSIDHLRSARSRRESYVGPWLPEPLVTDNGGEDPAAHAEEADTLSMAFLVLLERLSPVERAVFLLHDVFGYGYDEIAEIVGKTEANCRQLAVRARRHVEAERPRFEASRRQRDELAERFFAAVTEGDMDGLVQLLADDVVVYGDGGGKGPSWPKPVVGPDRVARLLIGSAQQFVSAGVEIRPRQVNGQPGAVVVDAQGRLVSVFALDIAEGVIQTVRSVINPEKLGHLGPLADVRGLMRQSRR